jgi:hypothetical protein
MVEGVPFGRSIEGGASFNAIWTGSLSWANRKPPSAIPDKNTATIANIITLSLRGEACRSYLSKSSLSRWSIFEICLPQNVNIKREKAASVPAFRPVAREAAGEK